MNDRISIEQRLNRLEEENGRLRRQCRWTQILAFVVGSGLILMGATASTVFKHLKVQQITITDENGRVRGQIGVDENGGIVQTFVDKSGTERIRIAVESDGTARRRIFDDEGHVRISSSAFPSNHPTAAGSAGQVFYDKGENKRIRIATDAEGAAVQQFRDSEGENQIVTGVDAAGTVHGFPSHSHPRLK